MKNQFPGFYPLSSKEFETLWANALFVFDTNVLLNLYRYPEEARDDLISRITQLADRIWLPYNVGLEYQRNRLTVVAEQKRRFRDVRQAIDASIGSLRGEFDRLQLKKRHSTIDVDGFLADVENTVAKFYSNLNSLESGHPSPQDPDPIRDKIDKLFDGKIGPAFSSQACLDAIYADGAKRYANRIPPGYSDLPKAKSESEDIFQYGSLVYRRQYGDLMIWHQITSYAKESNIQNIVLVTDDEKEDWWYRIESEGKKTIGPRPELVNEIRSVANVSLFHMYNSEQFLRRASEFLNVPVPETAIEQVQEAKRTIRHLNSEISSKYMIVERSVEKWLVDRFGQQNVIVQDRGFPDFLVTELGIEIPCGFETVYSREPRSIIMRLRDRIYRAAYEVSQGRLRDLTFVVVGNNLEDCIRMQEMVRSPRFEVPTGVKLMFCFLSEQVGFDESPLLEFTPE